MPARVKRRYMPDRENYSRATLIVNSSFVRAIEAVTMLGFARTRMDENSTHFHTRDHG